MLLSNLNLLAAAPSGVARLRELILTLAVQGKLVAQDPKDEPASELLQRVAANAPARSAKGLKASGDSDDVAKPYELPDGWAWSRLGEIVENMGSGWSPACDKGERSDPTQWAVLRTTAVQVNEYRAREHKVIPSKLSPRPEIEVKDGDILITRAGPMNRVGISCWVSNTPPRLMLSDKIVRFHSIADEMLPAFIVLALNAGWTKSQIESAKTGMAASQVNISQSDLRALWLPICSKAEQSRIVTRVQELMRLCDALEAKGQLEATQHAQLVSTLLATLTDSETPEQLADDLSKNWHRIATHFDLLLDRPEAVDALEQTILQLAVRGLLVPQDPQDEPATVQPDNALVNKGRPTFLLPEQWRWSRLGDLAELINGDRGQNYPNKAEYVSKGIPFINTGHIDPDGSLSSSRMNFLTREKFNSLRGGKVRKGDLVYCLRGATLGKTAIVDYEEGAIASSLVIVRPSAELNSEYAYLYLTSSDGRSFIQQHDNGSAQPNLAAASLKKYWIPLPPLAEQSRIVTRVAQLRRLCADLRQRLADSQRTQAHLAEALVENVA